MTKRTPGYLALISLALTLLWLILLIRDWASAGPLTTFDQVVAHARQTGWTGWLVIPLAGGAIMAALSGVNMVSGAGMLDFESCQSLEKLVLDAEAIGMAKRLIGGVEAREELGPVLGARGLEEVGLVGAHAVTVTHPHTGARSPRS